MTERFLEENCAPEQLSPLTLAFVGDGVYDLMVRERLVCQANRQAGKLHKLAVEQVKCQAQRHRHGGAVRLFILKGPFEKAQGVICADVPGIIL